MYKLIYPSINLFLYHRRSDLGDSLEQIREHQAEFWSNLPKKLQNDLNNDWLHSIFAREEKVEDPSYFELLTIIDQERLRVLKQANQAATHPFEVSVKGISVVDGYYYPVRLNDIYGLLLECSLSDRTYAQTVCLLKYLKVLMNEKPKQANLGKTWVISGFLPPLAGVTPRSIAAEAYRAFIGQEWKSPKQGKFLGATVFEVWQSHQDPEESLHVLIMIYPNPVTPEVREKTSERVAIFSKDWLRLLSCRHQIFSTYQQIEQLRKQLQSTYNLMINPPDLSKLSLETIQELSQYNLKKLSDYVIYVNKLEFYLQSLESNLKNYRNYYKILVEKANKIAQTDLSFLQKFTDFFQGQYLEQIKRERETFKSGINILENFIDTLRGTLELQQVSTYRHLEKSLIVVGAGVGSAAVVASASAPFMEELTQPLFPLTDFQRPSYLAPSLNLILVLLLSFFSGMLASFLTHKYWKSR